MITNSPTLRQKILFKHCDPAGIVFYPRYFEMINDCVEHFFSSTLEYPFEEMNGRWCVPAASIQTEFKAPSFHGDILDLFLEVRDVGRTSVKFKCSALCKDQPRFSAELSLVNASSGVKPTKWPSAVRGKLLEQLSQNGAPSMHIRTS